MNRIPLSKRTLPDYTRGEELFNMISHITGGALGIVALALCLCVSIICKNPYGILGGTIFSLSMILLYTMSSIYHGLHAGTGKKVLQVLDHCTIYGLIAGTYTPIVLCALAPEYPVIGWGLFAAEWILAITAGVLTAIDLKRYRFFSMACYIGMGWGIIFFLPQTLDVLSLPGFLILLAGGIAYTIGAVLFGLGKRIKWMHSVFHIFVILGSILQFLTIFLYVL